MTRACLEVDKGCVPQIRSVVQGKKPLRKSGANERTVLQRQQMVVIIPSDRECDEQ
jgi:hypothetical protein